MNLKVIWVMSVNKDSIIMILFFNFLRDWIPSSIYRKLSLLVHKNPILEFPDRRYLEEHILSCLRSANFSKILFVGCKWYTVHYQELFKDTNIEYWTTDIDKSSSFWGAKNRHIICDVQELDLHFPLHTFDVVLLNGVFGWGVNDEESMNRTIAAVQHVLKQGGVLMVGWNPGMVPDPCDIQMVNMLFDHESKLPLPKRKSFEYHVFDFFVSK